MAGGRASAPAAVCGMDSDPSAIASARAALAPELARAGWPCVLDVRDTLASARPDAIARLGPVPVVLGNPPWVASAQQRPAPWLDALLDDFRRDAHGEALGERKLGVLADCYVRFVRWACEVACHGQRGAVVAFVTNASYLDGPVHRGMRAALRRFFDALHVIDLGGNALLARSGERDDNVFGVRPAAAVLIALRLPGAGRARLANVRYQRMHGALPDKLARLARAGLDEPGFRALVIDGGHQRFVPTAATRDGYESWPSLAEAMPFHREGVQTNRDAVVVDRDRGRLLARLHAFASGETSPEIAVACSPLPHYDPERARAAVARALAAEPDAGGEAVVRAIAYRPLDTRWFAPIAPLCHRARPLLLAAMERSSFALISVRKDRGSAPWAHFGATRDVIDNCWLSNRSSCRSRAFPTCDPEGRDNLAPVVAVAFATRVGRAVCAADFARYALAVLASPHYRARHEDALRVDYPRIPPPRDAAHFHALCGAGERLVALFCDPLATGPSERPVADAACEELASDVRDTSHADFTVGHHRVLSENTRPLLRQSSDANLMRASRLRFAAIAALVATLADL